jgi:uncharacterized protein (DUF305 family)
MKYLVLVFIICLILFYLRSQKSKQHFSVPNPCIDYLSDLEFLEHMIPHHQVAIDMSVLLQPITKNPLMKEICRKIIWQQKYEISVMSVMLEGIPSSVSRSRDNMKRNYEKTKLEYYYPVKSSSGIGKCDPLFFKPNDHMAHMKHMETTDKSYLEHMIPHHQVAIDMSNRLLKHTKNDFMKGLCYDIIREQQYEILKMNEMLNNFNSWQYSSNLI